MEYTIIMIDRETGEVEEMFLDLTFSLETAVECIQEYTRIDMETWGKRRYEYHIKECKETRLMSL